MTGKKKISKKNKLYLISFFSFLLLLNNFLYAIELKDSITIKLIPEFITEGEHPSDLYVYIQNNTYDTVINIAGFRFQGLGKSPISFPVTFKHRPNQILFIQEGKCILNFSGWLNTNYYSIPNLLVIPPKSSLYIYHSFNEVEKSVIYGKGWKLYCYMNFAFKKTVDEFINKSNDTIISIYREKQIKSDSIRMDIYEFDSTSYKSSPSIYNELFFQEFLSLFKILIKN